MAKFVIEGNLQNLFDIDIELENELKKTLSDDYKIDSNGNLIRKYESIQKTYDVNYKIYKALKNLINNYDCQNIQVPNIDYSKKINDLNNYFINLTVDELLLIYFELKIKIKMQESLNQKIQKTKDIKI